MTSKSNRLARQISVEVIDIKYTLKRLELYIYDHSVDSFDKELYESLFESCHIINAILKISPYEFRQ